MLRRISTKWLLAVLVSIAVPFVGYSLYVNQKVTDRLARDVVRFSLIGQAADLATRVDGKVAERLGDAAMLAESPVVDWYVANEDGARTDFQDSVPQLFDGQVAQYEDDSYVFALDTRGRVVGTSTIDAGGEPLVPGVLNSMRSLSFGAEPWFERCMQTGATLVDVLEAPELEWTHRGRRHWFLGFAARIEPNVLSDESPGAVLILIDMSYIQRIIARFGVRQLGRGGEGSGMGGVGEDMFASSYAWIWSRDASTILAHLRPELVGSKLADLEGGKLQPLVVAARKRDWGLYPDYVFLKKTKKAAFKHLVSIEKGGLGWVVGVGADYSDIYRPVADLQDLLLTSTLVALLIATLLTSYFARRFTRPILDLRRTTELVAAGDLGARVEVTSRDEVGELGRAFNMMTAELQEGRDRIVQAEKEAAWREMARQVAHEVKNPLTPITLSVDLLRRARAEGRGDFDEVLGRTLDMIQRQVETMRDVTRDFAAFAGEHRAPEPVALRAVVEEVLQLSEAWAQERGVELGQVGRAHPDPAGDADSDADAIVLADPGELRRALLNLVSNGIEAMDDGGEMRVEFDADESWVEVAVLDTGPGLSTEALEHRFEPYFTTRSSGTGLGLAIVRRVIEDLGGSVSLDNRKPGPGAVARLRLPRHQGPRVAASEGGPAANPQA